MSKQRLLSFVMLPVLLLLSPGPVTQVRAGGVPIGLPAQEWTQLSNHVQLAMQYERQAQQVYNQVQMIRMMAQNGIPLGEIPMFSSMILSDIGGIRQIIQQTQGLSYGFGANDVNFRNTYSTYAQSTQPFYQQYNNWATKTLNTALGAARMAGLTQDQVWNEQQMNAKLQSFLSTPVGQEHSLEIANSLSFSMVGQMQKLRSLIAADMQSKAAFSGYQIAKDQAKEFDIGAATAYVDRDVDHTQFGNVPNSGR